VGREVAYEKPTRGEQLWLPCLRFNSVGGTGPGEMLVWGGTLTRLQRESPKVGSVRMETSRRA